MRSPAAFSDGGAALRAEREPLGVHEFDVVDADEAEELPDESPLQVATACPHSRPPRVAKTYAFLPVSSPTGPSRE